MNRMKLLLHNWLILRINEKLVRRHLVNIKGRVLDLGCGTAPYKEDILEVADEYIGVDWENSSHDQSNVDIFANLSEHLPFEDNYADTIVSFQVMEHIIEPSSFLIECYRILKSGGRILLTVPFMWHIHEEPHDYFRYTRHGLEYLFKKNGFVNIEITENTGFWQMWMLKFNYHTARFARGPLKIFFVPIWWLGQVIAPILDIIDHHPEETASYTLVARKPNVA